MPLIPARAFPPLPKDWIHASGRSDIENQLPDIANNKHRERAASVLVPNTFAAHTIHGPRERRADSQSQVLVGKLMKNSKFWASYF